MKVVLFGGSGGLGSKLSELLKEKYEVQALSSKDFDVVEDVYPEGIEGDIFINLIVHNCDGLISKQSSADIGQQIAVNVTGLTNFLNWSSVYFQSRAKTGKVILISSYLSVHPVKGAGIYSASKAFMDNIVKTFALENARYGITCNSIQLGYFDGGLTYKVPNLEKVVERIPLRRLGTIQELKNTVEFILSTDYVTGSNILVDGGVSLV